MAGFCKYRYKPIKIQLIRKSMKLFFLFAICQPAREPVSQRGSQQPREPASQPASQPERQPATQRAKEPASHVTTTLDNHCQILQDM